MFLAERNKNQKILYNLNVFMGSSLMILFAGFRSTSVGTDTNNYLGIFNHINKYKLSKSDTSIEYLYFFLNKLSYFLSKEFTFLLILIAIIVVYLNLKVIIKFSVNLWLSVFIFMIFGGYLFLFNGARQALAVAIISLAILQIYKRNVKKYIFWVVIASLFHNTALIMMPVYFFNMQDFSLKKSLVLGLIMSVLMMVLFQFLTLFSADISLRYSYYDERGATGAYILTSFYFVLTTLFVYLKKYISTRYLKEYNLYLNLCVLHTLIFLLVQFFSLDINIVRAGSYFQLGFILIYPIVFKEIKMFKDLFPRLLFFGIHILFYYIYLGRMSNLVPYTLNPSLNF
jgi:transmembrane protein EpsG